MLNTLLKYDLHSVKEQQLCICLIHVLTAELQQKKPPKVKSTTLQELMNSLRN